MDDLTHAMLVETRGILRVLVDIHERAAGRVDPNGKSLLSAAKKCVDQPLPPERK